MNDSGMSFLLRLAVAYFAVLLAIAGIVGLITSIPFAPAWERVRYWRFLSRRAAIG